MGLFDKLRGTASSVKRTADSALDQHGDKLAAGVDKAGGVVKKATKGKYDDKVDKGLGLAKKPLAKADAGGPAGPGTGGTGPGFDPSEPVVSADPVTVADPTASGTVDSGDPGDATSATGSESTKP